MSNEEIRVYEVTNEFLDELERRDITATEPMVMYCRAIAFEYVQLETDVQSMDP